MKLYNELYENGYYIAGYDIIKTKDDKSIWCIIVVGGRGTGKTYSVLDYMIENDEKFVFVKRTNEDVKLLCASAKSEDTYIDLSPFKPLNRDKNYNIGSELIHKGLGAFYYMDSDYNCQGSPVGYIASLNAIKDIKGFDLSDCNYIIFDEFIPNIYERVMSGEGKALLDLYETVSRDRELRGEKPLVLIALANATRISNPLFRELEIIDRVVELKRDHVTYSNKNGIMIRFLDDNADFKEVKKETAIMKSMRGTKWHAMAYDNDFAYDNFKAVKHQSIKGYRCIGAYKYKSKITYIYVKNGKYYICDSKQNTDNFYDLDVETERQEFEFVIGTDLRTATIFGDCLYKHYSDYDVIMNLKNLK